MKIVSPDFKSNPTALGNQYLSKCSKGKWFHFQRAYVIQKDSQYNGVSFNLFERIFQQFLQIFRVNYFAKCLKIKTITVLNNKDIGSFLSIEAITSKFVKIEQMLSKEEIKILVKEIKEQNTVIDLFAIVKDKNKIKVEILDQWVLSGVINAWSIGNRGVYYHVDPSVQLEKLAISASIQWLLLGAQNVYISLSPKVDLTGAIVRDLASINKEEESQ